MKKIVLIIVILFSLVIAFDLSDEINSSHRIFKVISPVEIYIDFNKNLLFDEVNPYVINNINYIQYDKDYSDDKILAYLSAAEKFFLNYKARENSDRVLKNKFVRISNNAIFVDNERYEDLLLNSGFFYTDDDNSKRELIEKIHKIHLDDYYIYNLKSKKLHKLSCEQGRLSKKYIIIDKSFVTNNSSFCKFCFGASENVYNKNNDNSSESYTKPVIDDVFKTKNLSIFFLDLNKIYSTSNGCTTSACIYLKQEINNAESSIDFAIYGINNQPEIVNALIQAQKRGVKIRWVCDYDNGNINYYPDTEKLKLYLTDYNTDKDYEKNNRDAIMHNKFFIFDNKKVWTGSANITGTDLTGFNANYSVLINSSDIASFYLREFEQMYNNKFHKDKNSLDKTTVKINDNTTILPLFSPEDDILKYIIDEISQANQYIYIPIFFITSKKLIQPLIDAHNRGVDIKIINDATNAHNNYSIHKILRKNNIEVKTENYAGKMHMKALIIDDRISIIGSMNFTKSGNNYNDENVLLIENPEITKYLKTSFLYLWNKIPDKYLNIDPPAESVYSIGSCTDGIDNDFDGKIDTSDEGCKYKKH